jgi:hypothetical protein
MYMRRLVRPEERKGNFSLIPSCQNNFIQPPILCSPEGTSEISTTCRYGRSLYHKPCPVGDFRGLALSNKWTNDPLRPTFTHHSPTGVTRVDCLNMNNDLLVRKTGTKILLGAFTDHWPLRFSLPTIEVRGRRGFWKTDRFWRLKHASERRYGINGRSEDVTKSTTPLTLCSGRGAVGNNSSASSGMKKQNIVQITGSWVATCTNLSMPSWVAQLLWQKSFLLRKDKRPN